MGGLAESLGLAGAKGGADERDALLAPSLPFDPVPCDVVSLRSLCPLRLELSSEEDEDDDEGDGGLETEYGVSGSESGYEAWSDAWMSSKRA